MCNDKTCEVMEDIIKLINQELDNNIIENEIAKHKVDLNLNSVHSRNIKCL